MNTKVIYLAGGCFWGTEHFIKQIQGVISTETGFANGHDVADLRFLLELYFKAIDPTSLNKQGEDEGTRYRTGIYYTDCGDLPIIQQVFNEVAQQYDRPLAVEVLPLSNYYAADEYHQDYLDKHPDGYCHLSPALFEFARKARRK